MKAMLIDPFEGSVKEVETDGSLESIYGLMDCYTIEVIRPDDAQDDLIVLDEEGKYVTEQQYFLCDLWPHDALAGKALWIGQAGAEFCEPAASGDYVTDHITWVVAI
ncbi:hypothetical protein QF000_001710 [Paraburkholderia atlantica]